MAVPVQHTQVVPLCDARLVPRVDGLEWWSLVEEEIFFRMQNMQDELVEAHHTDMPEDET